MCVVAQTTSTAAKTAAWTEAMLRKWSQTPARRLGATVAGASAGALVAAELV